MTGYVDPAFKVVKVGEPAFHIWRVEKLDIRPLPRDHYGEFFDGDSYIVFNAAGTKQGGKMEMHIHFWLGKDTTTDESTVAAIKTVELDDYLGGHPIQHREVQGYESARFKAYFKTGLRILKGGVATGLRHVSHDFEARLFSIKGKRSPVLTQLSPISWSHFNTGDCYILQTTENIFIWIGAESNRMEKLQATKVATQLRDERPETNIVFVDDSKEKNLYPTELEEFSKYLPLDQRSVQPAVPDSDTQAESTRTTIKLYRCNDDSGTCKIVQEKEGPLLQSDLNSDDSFIVDNASNGIWVWVGRRATNEERRQAMSNAQGFVVKKSYPKGTPVTRVIDGAEPTEFRALFTNWRDPRATVRMDRQYSMSKIAPTINTKFDATTLHSEPALAADTQLVDDGTGNLTVWRLHDKDLEIVPPEMFGVFFDGDCYLLHYSYEVNTKKNHILYYWLGTHSAQDERGTIAWHTVKKDDELNGAAVQVRVVQGKEPPHLLTIFKGKMIVFTGGYASSFDGEGAADVGIPSEFLIQVRGDGDTNNTRAVQVDRRATSLNSNDVFVLAAGANTYLWCGKGSTGDERERAKAIAGQWAAAGELVVVSEGQEKSQFWEAFPQGKEDYANDERLRQSDIRIPARLFQCSNASGVFKAEEIYDFAQSDLVSDDIMVLDTGSAIFIWIGCGANKEERLSVAQLVHDYLSSDPRGRDIDTPMIQIQQGYEPPNFTGFFGPWDPKIWEADDFDTVRNKMEIVRVPPPKKEPSKYSITALQERDPEKLPADVDPLNKEQHLSDEDFKTVFHMEKEDYFKLPEWRRQNLKKSANLY